MATMQDLNRYLSPEQKKEFVRHIGTNSPAYLFSHVGRHRRPSEGLARRIEEACKHIQASTDRRIPIVTPAALFEQYDSLHPAKQ